MKSLFKACLIVVLSVAPALASQVFIPFQLPSPTTPGGVFSSTCPAHQWVNQLDTSGNLDCTHPAGADIASGGNLSFEVSGGTSSVSLAAFGDRTLSILDFGGDWTGLTNSDSALVAAQSAALLSGKSIIRMDCLGGPCQYHFASAIVLDAGISLVCPDGAPFYEPANNDYGTVFDALVVNAGSGTAITANDGGVFGCPVLTPTLVSSTPVASWRANYNLRQGFAGTAFGCVDFCTFENDAAIGFAVCVDNQGAQYFRGEANDCDGKTHGLALDSQGAGQITINGFHAEPFATRSYTGLNPLYAENPISIASLTNNGSGLIRGTLSTTCSIANACPQTGDVGYMVNASLPSATGKWTATATTTYIDFQSSDAGFFAGKTLTGSITSGSNIITGLSSTAEVQGTQTVVSGGCFAGGTVITKVERRYGIIQVSNNSTCTNASASLTITDVAIPLQVSSAAIVSGGAGCKKGDILDLNGGTLAAGGTAAQLEVKTAPSGVVTGFMTMLPNPGEYSALPVGTATTTADAAGSTCTGVTVTVSSSMYWMMEANNAPGDALDVVDVNDATISDFKSLNYANGAYFGANVSGVTVSNCKLDANNALQDQTEVGVQLDANAKQVLISGCGIDYNYDAIVDSTQAGSSIGSNVIMNADIPSNGASGVLQNIVAEVVSPTPGTAKKTSLVLSDLTGLDLNSFVFVSQDTRGVTLTGDDLSRTTLWMQNSTATANTVDAGTNKWLAEINGLSGIIQQNGGVQSAAQASCLTHQYMNALLANSNPAGCRQPSVADLSEGSTGSGPVLQQKQPAMAAGATGTGTFPPEGALFSITAAATTGSGSSEQTLSSYSLPANSLDSTGRNIRVSACFLHAADTNTVTSKIYFGSETIGDGGTTTSGGVSCLFLQVTKTGSSQQSVTGYGFKPTAVAPAIFTAATESDTSAITIKATGTDASGTSGDDKLVNFVVEYLN